ncbi:glycosyltransferase family 4 protein [Zhongshania marina]|uniref:Glycosyltransferase n=1 Tax=Zhongshania marina TaxID=2304603 RepID=A0ABX9W891_9GAMM|nr:glycosyltransferase [Zhongshania marina]
MDNHLRKVVVPLPADVWGGLQGVVAKMDGHLKSLGYEQIVLVPHTATVVHEKLSDLGVNCQKVQLPRFKRSPIEAFRSFIDYPAAIKLLAQNEFVKNADIFQVVGVHHFHSLLLSKKLKRPLVWQLHSTSVTGIFRILARSVILHFEDGVLANGHKVGTELLGGGFSKGNRGVFYPPISIDEFSKNECSRKRVRKLFGFGEGDIVLMSVGNRGWQKNHELLIKVAATLLTEKMSFRFLVVGATVEGYIDEYQKGVLDPASQLNNIKPNYITFANAPDGIADLVQGADVLLLTSHAEGIPLVIAEAMAASKPIVSTNVGGISEVVENDITGYICSPGNVEEIASKLRLIALNSNYEIMGDRSRRYAEKLFSAERAAIAHARVYDRALELYAQNH